MIPYRLTDFYDPEPDYDRIDAAYDARREAELARRRPPPPTPAELERLRALLAEDEAEGTLF
jgi:hypothetical protein